MDQAAGGKGRRPALESWRLLENEVGVLLVGGSREIKGYGPGKGLPLLLSLWFLSVLPRRSERKKSPFENPFLVRKKRTEEIPVVGGGWVVRRNVIMYRLNLAQKQRERSRHEKNETDQSQTDRKRDQELM